MPDVERPWVLPQHHTKSVQKTRSPVWGTNNVYQILPVLPCPIMATIAHSHTIHRCPRF